MKKILFWMSLLAIPFLFAACDEETDDNNGGNFDPKDAPALISKVTTSSSYETSSYTNIVEFEYDANNLITRVDYSYIEVYDGSTYQGSDYTIYAYDSQNRPTSAISYDSDDIGTDKEEFTYSSGKIELISYYLSNEIWEPNYKVVFEIDDNGHITKENYIEYYDGEWLDDEDYSTYSWGNNNVTKVEFYELEGTKKKSELMNKRKSWPIKHKPSSLKSVKGFVKEGEASINYDSIVNPFAYASIKNLMSPFDGGVFYTSKNLTTGYSGTEYDDAGNETFTASYAYEMNSKNFPTKVTIASAYSWVEDGQPITETDTEVYDIEYK